MSSCGGLLVLALLGEALDGGVQHEVLPHRDLWPQDVKLRAHAQVLPDGGHVGLDAQAADDGITCQVHQDNMT